MGHRSHSSLTTSLWTLELGETEVRATLIWADLRIEGTHSSRQVLIATPYRILERSAPAINTKPQEIADSIVVIYVWASREVCFSGTVWGEEEIARSNKTGIVIHNMKDRCYDVWPLY